MVVIVVIAVVQNYKLHSVSNVIGAMFQLTFIGKVMILGVNILHQLFLIIL